MDGLENEKDKHRQQAENKNSEKAKQSSQEQGNIKPPVTNNEAVTPDQRPAQSASDKSQVTQPEQAAKDAQAPRPSTPKQDPAATQLSSPAEAPQKSTPPPKSPAADGTMIVPPEQLKKNASSKPAVPKAKAQQPPPTQKSATNEEDSELLKLRQALKGKYEITKKLGEGGMAAVYHAREISLNREVAIKLLPQSFMRDKTFIDRFKQEAQVAANLEHPNIVRIYNIDEKDDLVYFVMSYISGGSLSDQLKKGPLPVDNIVQWGMDTASALGYAHDHGVIHRDLKPDNIMLDKSNRAIVMDYGIARAGQGTGLTQTGAVIGTPQFMSPEQARGRDIDARSDIYSMGLVLYQLATGTLPFTADDAASLMYMHVHETPEPPDVRNKEVPAWLRDIILKCLAKNPDDRFAHAKQLSLALAEHKAPEITEKTMVQHRASEEKSKTGIFIPAAVIVALVAAAGWFWLSSERTAPEQASRQTSPQPAQTQTSAPAQPQVSADDLAYQQAEMIHTKQAYSTYIDKYPEGTHIDAAQDKLAAFAEDEQKLADAKRLEERDSQARRERQTEEQNQAEAQRQAEAAKQDDSAYDMALATNTAMAYSTYLQQFPAGKHINDARSKIGELNALAAKAANAEEEQTANRDDEAYRNASATGSKEAYSTYLISFPAGTHAGEAKSMIADIEARAAFGENIRVQLSAMSINMVDLPSGSFQMGSASGSGDEKPVRTVSLKAFTVSTTETTQAQYQTVMNDNPSFHKLDDNMPVEKVNYQNAIEFCNRLSEKLNLEACYNLSTGVCDYSKNGFRLPTEAEWEYACRAGNGAEYYTGNGESALARAAWYAGSSREQTHPVAQKNANAFGLFDMHGNVWEWTNDWYSKQSYENGGADNPTGVASGKEKVLRGGSWLDYPQDCTSSKRRKYDPKKNYTDIGFRIVRR